MNVNSCDQNQNSPCVFFRAFLFLSVLLAAHTPFAANAAPSSLAVTVSIPPVTYFVERVGGDAVTVTVMAGKGQDPHTYEPTAAQMRGISEAELYFAIGVPFETRWLPKFKALNPAMRIVSLHDAVERIKGRPDLAMRDTLPGKGRHRHDHDDGQGERRHGLETDDPHVWLAPADMLRTVPLIVQALGEKRPDMKETFEKRGEALRNDMADLDARIRELFASLDNRIFLTFHQSWAHYARNFALREVSVELDGREPGPKSMAKLMDFAKENAIRAIVADGMTSRSTLTAVARNIKATAVTASPLEEDWPNSLLEFSEKLAAALKGRD